MCNLLLHGDQFVGCVYTPFLDKLYTVFSRVPERKWRSSAPVAPRGRSFCSLLGRVLCESLNLCTYVLYQGIVYFSGTPINLDTNGDRRLCQLSIPETSGISEVF